MAVLYIDYREIYQFGKQDFVLFRFFAHQASHILHSTWFLRRYQEVTRIGQEINQELDIVDALFHKLHRHATGILDIQHLLQLAIHQPETGTIDLYPVAGEQWLHH
jgi:hypothetical protein